MVETVNIQHMPPEHPVYIGLYKDVKNATFLRQQLLEGNSQYEYAFIDASIILSRTHLLCAIFRAMNDWLEDRLKSKNVHSEIVFCLSPNNNIGEAFRRFGVSDETKDMVVVKVQTDSGLSYNSVSKFLVGAVKGTEIEFSDEVQKDVCDLKKVKKYYKSVLQVDDGGDSGKKRKAAQDEDQSSPLDSAQQRSNIEKSIVAALALRGAT